MSELLSCLLLVFGRRPDCTKLSQLEAKSESACEYEQDKILCAEGFLVSFSNITNHIERNAYLSDIYCPHPKPQNIGCCPQRLISLSRWTHRLADDRCVVFYDYFQERLCKSGCLFVGRISEKVPTN